MILLSKLALFFAFNAHEFKITQNDEASLMQIIFSSTITSIQAKTILNQISYLLLNVFAKVVLYHINRNMKMITFT